MNNISLNKEPLELHAGKHYLVFDVIYLQDVQEYISETKQHSFSTSILKRPFPYTQTPFAKFIPNKNIFHVEQIQKIEYNEIEIIDQCFSTDIAIIVFILESKFWDFLDKYSYDKLLDANFDLINIQYWNELYSLFELNDIALIVAPGLDSGCDFEGSGTYIISDSF